MRLYLAESFIFQFTLLYHNDKNTQNYDFAFVLDGCEAWPLTLREEDRPRLTVNRLLWEIFGAKGDAVTGNWRNILNVELHELEIGGVCSTYCGEEKCIQAFVWRI